MTFIDTTAAVTAAGIPVAPASPSSQFGAALAEFNRKNACFLELCGSPGHPDQGTNEACADTDRAYLKLVAAPAPDFKAVSAKLDAIVAWRDDSPIPEGEIELVARDMRALVGRAN